MKLREAQRRTRSPKATVEDLRSEVHRWAEKIGVRPARVQVQRMTTKWASCSRGGRICLSRDLLSADPSFRELVIVHELLHLQIPNHGRLFRSLLSAYKPDWESLQRDWGLRTCGGR